MSAIVLTALAGFFVAAEPAKEDSAKMALAKLQGTWTVVSAAADGHSIDALKGKKFKIDGEILSIVNPANDKEKTKITVKVDPAKSPAQIDWLPDDKNEPPMLGIYQLDGDTLKVLLGGGKGTVKTDAKTGKVIEVKKEEAKRPAAFDAKGALLFTFKRDKK
jgi:uncharacterized protein (TIGR03067 family)